MSRLPWRAKKVLRMKGTGQMLTKDEMIDRVGCGRDELGWTKIMSLKFFFSILIFEIYRGRIEETLFHWNCLFKFNGTICRS